jgi:NTP pyrophosphatase (non-canonical NTP hydrolase)
MTTIKEMVDFQRKFDDKHGWCWSAEPDRKVERLQEGVVCMTGELGEFANELKKVIRHSERGFATEELWAGMREELADVFIYFLKLADLLGMQIDEEYFAKMAKNAKRFEKFEVNGK